MTTKATIEKRHRLSALSYLTREPYEHEVRWSECGGAITNADLKRTAQIAADWEAHGAAQANTTLQELHDCVADLCAMFGDTAHDVPVDAWRLAENVKWALRVIAEAEDMRRSGQALAVCLGPMNVGDDTLDALYEFNDARANFHHVVSKSPRRQRSGGPVQLALPLLNKEKNE